MKNKIILLSFSLLTFHFSFAQVIPINDICSQTKFISGGLHSNTEMLAAGILCKLPGSSGSGGTIPSTVTPIDSICSQPFYIYGGLHSNTEMLLGGIYCKLLGGGGGSGTVTSFSSGNANPLFTTSVATATTTPALSFTRVVQNANLFYGGPTSGGSALPTFRALVPADIPRFLIARNGLTPNADTIELGGTLLHNTFIATTASYYLSVSGGNSSRSMYTENTGTGRALDAISNSGDAFLAASGGGWGVNATSTTGGAGFFTINPSSTNTQPQVMRFQRSTTGTAANNLGGTLDLYSESNNGNARLSNQLLWKWSDATDATRTSVFEIWNTNNGVSAKKFSISGAGQVGFTNYGSGTFSSQAPTYAISTDASGNLVETQAIVSYKQSITALQAATLNSSPVDITDLPAPGASYAWEIVTMSVKYTFLTADYDFGQIQINTETTNINGFQFSDTNFQGAGGSSVWTQGTVAAGAKNCFIANKKMQITADADPTVGDGTFIVYGTARLIKL